MVWSLALLAGFALGTAPPANAQGVYSTGWFELGDGMPPAGTPGLADIVGDPAVAGPDWADLFDAAGEPRDDYPYDPSGNPLGNGIPDYREVWGGEWAVFSADDISAGTAPETSARHADGGVFRSTAAADHDLGFGYVYQRRGQDGELVLYLGVERSGAGASSLELELNQEHFRLGHGGFGHDVPWTVVGNRAFGDLLVQVEVGREIGVSSLAVWDGEAWQPISALDGEGCDGVEAFCVLGNAAIIEGGPWSGAGEVPAIDPGRFLEIGARFALFGATPPALATVQFRTPQDIAFGYFGEEN